MIIFPSLEEIKQVTTILEKRDTISLFRVVLDLRTQEQLKSKLSIQQQLKVYTYEWLKHLGFLNEANIRIILKQANLELSKYGTWLEGSPFPKIKSPTLFTLSIIDKKYAIWTGAQGWLDLEEETLKQEPKEPKVTFITCNLYDCFLLKQLWLNKLKGSQDG